MPTPKGYPSQKKADNGTAEFVTLSPIAALKHGLDVALGGTYFNHSSQVIEAGSTTTQIVLTAHDLRVGDKLRFTGGALINEETSVVKVIDANTVQISPELSSTPAASDPYDILRPVTLTLGEDGSFSGPVKFVKDSNIVDVTEDTATPANNLPLPVKLTSVTGDINITANDLNVQLSHSAANPDSTQIGDGTEIMQINASGEAQVADDTARTSLASIDTNTGTIASDTTSLDTKVDVALSTRASEATLAAAETHLGSIETSNSTIATDTTSIDGKTPALGAAVTAVSTPVNIASDQTVPISAASLPLPTGAATEATLSSVDTKTPSLGAALTASSTPVNIASDQTVPVSAASLPLPTGAATETTLGNLLTELQAKADLTETQPVSAVSLPLPAGASTEAKQDTIITALGSQATATKQDAQTALLTTIDADTSVLAGLDTGSGAVTAATRRVHLSDESLAALENITVDIDHKTVVDTTYTDASSTNIPGNATDPLQLIASTGSAIKKLQFADTTGAFLEIMIGAAASETRVCLVGPGSDQTIELDIPATTRVSVRRVDDSAAIAEGSLAVNYIG